VNTLQQKILEYLTDPGVQYRSERAEVLRRLVHEVAPGTSEYHGKYTLPLFTTGESVTTTKRKAQNWLHQLLSEGLYCRTGLADAAKALGLEFEKRTKKVRVVLDLDVEDPQNEIRTGSQDGGFVFRLPGAIQGLQVGNNTIQKARWRTYVCEDLPEPVAKLPGGGEGWG
jgi:hypothetical protein